MNMAFIIVVLLLVGYLLIGTSHITRVNRAAIAMFVCTVGWVMYISYGTDFVMSQHARGFLDFLSGELPNSNNVKYYIYDDIFLNHVGKAAAVLLFLLSTMSIIEILNNNGCFDFISEWIRTRNSKRLLWTITIATFVISANLDNLTTTVMMLVIMRNVVQNRKQRMLIGSAVVLAANTGGSFTVIGDPASVVMWGNGAVTATNFSAYLFLPAVTAWVVFTYLIGRSLPDRLDLEWHMAPYRGDDTNLNRWQRIVMLLVGIGGLWFIPTFHNITKLSPFVGALCVLSILWVVNEVFNRKLYGADQMTTGNRMPAALQYGTIQQMLFVLAVMLGIGVVYETGIFSLLAEYVDYQLHNVWGFGLIVGVLSGIIDTFAIAVTSIYMYPVMDGNLNQWADADYLSCFMQNGIFWKIIAYSTGVGGCFFCFANVGGLALMKMERMKVSWYLKHCTWKVCVGWLLGYLVLFLKYFIMR